MKKYDAYESWLMQRIKFAEINLSILKGTDEKESIEAQQDALDRFFVQRELLLKAKAFDVIVKNRALYIHDRITKISYKEYLIICYRYRIEGYRIMDEEQFNLIKKALEVD